MLQPRFFSAPKARRRTAVRRYEKKTARPLPSLSRALRAL
jgi:hypothetical protein